MIHIVLGTKAQLIKMAPIMKALKDRGIEYNFVSTGQHRDTVDDILDNFGIKKPDRALYSGKDITSIPQMALWSAKILLKTLTQRSAIFANDDNGIVLVHGDTFSTLLGAIMGKVAGMDVGHVESGLRSYNLWQPFPEEMIRRATFRLADVMFCPGQWALDNLEKFSAEKINTYSNTLYDSLLCAMPTIEAIEGVEVPEDPYAIVTLHRFENFRSQHATENVVEAVERIANHHKLLFILHKPTEINLKKFGLFDRIATNPNIETRPRYDYFRFIKLILSARFVVSDGGSNQEECYYLGKPLLLLRNVTERTEGVGRNAVVSKFDRKTIDEFSADPEAFKYPLLQQEHSPCKIIVDSCRPYND